MGPGSLSESRDPAERTFRIALLRQEILYHRVEWTLEKAVMYGRIDILKRNKEIWKNVVPIVGYSIDIASQCGHLEIVQWLHANRSERCTNVAMNWAAHSGHLEIVDQLISHDANLNSETS